jgi:hypothetical protein
VALHCADTAGDGDPILKTRLTDEAAIEALNAEEVVKLRHGIGVFPKRVNFEKAVRADVCGDRARAHMLRPRVL